MLSNKIKSNFGLQRLKKLILLSTVVASLSLISFNLMADTTFKVGVAPGKELELAEVAKKVAKEKYNLDVELLTMNDTNILNEAVNTGELDANAFQHRPYLDEQNIARGHNLVAVANTFVYPIAAYSKKIKSIEELKEGSTVAIPNDMTNLGRSLLLLQKSGVIKLKEDVGLNPTTLDITENPKNLRFLELDAPQLPRSLDDEQVELAVINTIWAAQIGLSPTKDGILIEDKESPYVNIIVTREENKDNPDLQKFIQAYQSEEVDNAAKELFNGGAVKGW